MDQLISVVNYGLTLWFLNYLRETIVSLDTIWSVQGIACIIFFLAGVVYLFACYAYYSDPDNQ